jgi:hypothetical protein
MKANEFFKAMGIKAVRQFLDNDNIRTKEMHDDLKRLVKSHGLVEKLGGLEKAKDYVPDGYKSEQLKQAITDVESC